MKPHTWTALNIGGFADSTASVPKMDAAFALTNSSTRRMLARGGLGIGRSSDNDNEVASHVFPVDTYPVYMPNEATAVYRKWHGSTQRYSYTIGGDQGIVVWYAYDRPRP